MSKNSWNLCLPMKNLSSICGAMKNRRITPKGVGRNSVDKLIESEYQTIDDLESVSLLKLIDIGIREPQAGLIIQRVQKQYR